MLKKLIKAGSIVGSAIFLLIAGWAFFIEPKLLSVKHFHLDIPKWHKEHRPLKFAVLSDFHIGFGCMDRKRLDRIIRMTNAENPDFILLLGDYINTADKNPKYINYLTDFKNFKSKYGVYAVLGNHESWDVRSEIRFVLHRAGVNLLENRAAKLTLKNYSFWLAGIEDLTTGHPSLTPILKKVSRDNNPVLLLSHNPDIYMTVPKRISLTISGHTHGGQIYIPALAHLISPSHFGKKFLSGHVLRKENHFFVTSGLGTTILPARLFVPPEIIILHFE